MNKSKANSTLSKNSFGIESGHISCSVFLLVLSTIEIHMYRFRHIHIQEMVLY